MQIQHQINIYVLLLAALLVASLVKGAVDFVPTVTRELAVAERPAGPSQTAYRAAVLEHFEATDEEEALLEASGLAVVELPVVLHLARQAVEDPAAVLARRRSGMSWQQVAAAAGLGPETFYFPVAAPGTRFEPALRPFTQRPRSAWDEIELTDDQVRNLVNLRVLAAAAPRGSEDVTLLSAAGADFVTIHDVLQGGDHPVATQC